LEVDKGDVRVLDEVGGRPKWPEEVMALGRVEVDATRRDHIARDEQRADLAGVVGRYVTGMKQALKAQRWNRGGADRERGLVEVIGGGDQLPRAGRDSAGDQRCRALIASHQ